MESTQNTQRLCRLPSGGTTGLTNSGDIDVFGKDQPPRGSFSPTSAPNLCKRSEASVLLFLVVLGWSSTYICGRGRSRVGRSWLYVLSPTSTSPHAVGVKILDEKTPHWVARDSCIVGWIWGPLFPFFFLFTFFFVV